MNENHVVLNLNSYDGLKSIERKYTEVKSKIDLEVEKKTIEYKRDLLNTQETFHEFIGAVSNKFDITVDDMLSFILNEFNKDSGFKIESNNNKIICHKNIIK